MLNYGSRYWPIVSYPSIWDHLAKIAFLQKRDQPKLRYHPSSGRSAFLSDATPGNLMLVGDQTSQRKKARAELALHGSLTWEITKRRQANRRFTPNPNSDLSDMGGMLNHWHINGVWRESSSDRWFPSPKAMKSSSVKFATKVLFDRFAEELLLLQLLWLLSLVFFTSHIVTPG